jgi:hypothetical protein
LVGSRRLARLLFDNGNGNARFDDFDTPPNLTARDSSFVLPTLDFRLDAKSTQAFRVPSLVGSKPGHFDCRLYTPVGAAGSPNAASNRELDSRTRPQAYRVYNMGEQKANTVFLRALGTGPQNRRLLPILTA